MRTSVIYQGDNLDVLPDLQDESVDLIYIDPPFNSDRRYETFWGDTEQRAAFEDRFGDTNKYINWLRPRIIELNKKLKPEGSFYVHCDTHANYRIRSLMEELGLHFQSEIVWKRSSAHSNTKQGTAIHGRIHDTIYFFSKHPKRWTWNPVHMPYDEEYVHNFYKHVEKGTQRRYRLDNLTGPGGASKGNPKYEVMGVERHWRYSRKRMQELIEAGRIIQTKPGNVPQYKRYLDEMPGVPLQDVWTDIRPASKKERIGYPTQKPVALMERILLSATNEGDVVLDAFCGCGTTIVAATGLGRQWVGIDISPTACRVMEARLARDLGWRKNKRFWVVSSEKDLEELREMPPYEFQNWVMIKLGGIPGSKGADMGIDGRVYLANPNVPDKLRKASMFEVFAGKQKNIDFSNDIPVQVKRVDKAGRKVVDEFNAALRREKRSMGIIVAFDFTKDAHTEASRLKKHDGLIIHLFTVQQLLEMRAA